MSFFSALDDLSTYRTTIPAISKEDMKKIEEKYDALVARESGISKTSPDYYHPQKRVSVIGVMIPGTGDKLKLPARTGDWTDPKFQGVIQIARLPFARGGVRAAYRGRMRFDRGEWEDVIVKEFMFPNHRLEKEYISQSENSAWAKSLIDLYRATSEGKSLSKPIEVVPSRVIKVVEEGGGGEILYNMERCLSGAWKRWTTNGAYIALPNRDLLRFSSWSYEYTSNYLIVTDLQGVETSAGIFITDPAVLCKDSSRFGPTNLSSPIMDECYEAAKHGATLPSRRGPVSAYTVRKDGLSLHMLSEREASMVRHEAESRGLGLTLTRAPAVASRSVPTCGECGGSNGGHLGGVLRFKVTAATRDACSLCGRDKSYMR